jgi:hypothetical protein
VLNEAAWLTGIEQVGGKNVSALQLFDDPQAHDN